jgi:uncharacterized protein (DUF433 family)
METAAIAVDSDPDIQSGELCFANTRIPVRCVLSFGRAGYGAHAIQREYPSLSIEQIEACLALLSEVKAYRAEGWKLVPVEPTQAMLSRFRGLNRVRDTAARARLDYQDMLDASPPMEGE